MAEISTISCLDDAMVVLGPNMPNLGFKNEGNGISNHKVNAGCA